MRRQSTGGSEPVRYVCGAQQRAARSCVGELSVRAAELVDGCSELTAGVLEFLTKQF